MNVASVGVNSDTAAWQLVKDLHRPRPARYWTDLLLSAAIGWSLVVLAAYNSSGSALFWLGVLGATFALYRGLCFVHEISHLRQKCIPGLSMVWDLILGVPLLMPSFLYVGVHSNHHSLATYGTEQDPEYLPFARSHRMAMAFIAHSVLIPLALLVRFLLLSPVALLWPRFHDWLIVHASSLSMNVAFRRDNSPALSATIKRWEAVILLVWIAGATLALRYGIVGKLLLVWYLVTASISLSNTLRTLGAHRYESAGTPLNRSAQLRDSIDTPGAFVTELWAPPGTALSRAASLFSRNSVS